MSLISRLFGSGPAPVRDPHPPSQPHSGSSQNPKHASFSESSSRREILRTALRQTLLRHGIPVGWVGAEILAVTSRARHPGLHWRLLFKHWDPRLLVHSVALQDALIQRVMTMDPLADQWLMGVSWQFSLADGSVCPPLPHPDLWTAEPEVAGGAGDVISGPVLIDKAAPSDESSARADLERLLAVRDADFRHHAGNDDPGYMKTQPMQL